MQVSSEYGELNVGQRANRSERVAIVVVGMHRSGTSALTRVLSLLGCDLPVTLMPAGEGNELGHWESEEICRLNESILQSAGARWDEWKPVNPGWYQSAKAAEYRDRALAVMNREFGESRLFILKDPRICLLVPFWLEVLGEMGVRPHAVFSVRNPEEVARSLASRDGHERAYSRLVWLRHVFESEFALRGVPRAFTAYDDLLDCWPVLVERLQAELGIVLPRTLQSAGREIEQFLQDDMRHFAEKPERTLKNPMLSPWLRDSYDVFLRWSRDGEDKADYAQLDHLRAAFDSSVDAFSELIEVGSEAIQKARQLESRIEDLDAIEDIVSRQNEELAHMGEAQASSSAELSVALEQVKSLEVELGTTRSDAQQAQKLLHDQLDQMREAQACSSVELSAAVEQVESLKVELDTTRSDAQQAQKLLHDQLDQMRSALDQRRAELADTHAQIEQLEEEGRETRARLGTDLEAARQEAAVLQGFLSAAETRLRVLEEGLFQAQGEAHALTVQLDNSQQALAELRREFEGTVLEKDERIAQIHKDGNEARQQIAIRFQEIAAMARAMNDTEEARKFQEARAERLRAITAVLMRSGRLQAWLPARFIKQRELRMLKKRGLFDAETYLALNPDVAGDEMDPLRHFILHGEREGRPTGLE